MSLAIVYTRGRQGIAAPLVTVEVHISNGLPALNIVGLPEAAVKESKDRVRGALLNCHFEFPMQRVTVNMAPADIPKEGGRFDLPIALGILAASGQLPHRALQDMEFLGELSLGGELRPVAGVLPAALQARDAGRALVIPTGNADEAALVEAARVLPANHLLEVCAHINGQRPIMPAAFQPPAARDNDYPDFSEVHGHFQVKRALEIAAAGRHNLLMMGPPGTGKSMLASRLPGILPPLSDEEALESAAIASVSDTPFNPQRWRQPPFRSPHHTASAPALVGGGGNPKPGEVSLATHGVLFLDELPEFDRKVLEVLREPLETGTITISRAARQVDFPARFQLIAAMNPCPCGYQGHPIRKCYCSPDAVARYRGRISGPLLDRIDLFCDVQTLSAQELQTLGAGEDSASVKARVLAARARQLARQGKYNAWLEGAEIDRYCDPEPAAKAILTAAIDKLGLSARAYHRVLKVARTLADRDLCDTVGRNHVLSALQFRRSLGDKMA